MQGLEAINAANGWAMAYTGAAIVMTGLTVLSLIISQLHRIVRLMEKPEQKTPVGATTQAETADSTEIFIDEDRNLMDPKNAVDAYQALTRQIEEPFGLDALYALTKEHDLPHPHLTIKGLRETGQLLASGEGLYSWKKPDSPEAVVSESVEAPAEVPAAPATVEVAAQASPTPEIPAVVPEPIAVAPEPATLEPAPATVKPATTRKMDGTPLIAPMPGMIVRYEKQVGDLVSEGETIVILEAMKMENALSAPVDGTVKSIRFSSGDTVAKEEVLCVIG